MGNHHFYYQANHHTKWDMVSSSQVVTVTLPKALRQKLLKNGIVLYSNGSRQSPMYIYIHMYMYIYIHIHAYTYRCIYLYTYEFQQNNACGNRTSTVFVTFCEGLQLKDYKGRSLAKWSGSMNSIHKLPSLSRLASSWSCDIFLLVSLGSEHSILPITSHHQVTQGIWYGKEHHHLPCHCV
jgi:hypothetical protein